MLLLDPVVKPNLIWEGAGELLNCDEAELSGLLGVAPSRLN
jgi:hypothetical protein